MFRRTLGQPVLFAIIYTVVAAALYFSLGVVAGRALGLTPVVYFIAGVFFLLAAMTYVEGASLHQDRAGATVFARYAFNELVSFVAGWVMLLDYVILLSVTAFTATHYLAAFWGPLGRGSLESLVALGILAWVAWRSIRGFARTRVQRMAAYVIAAAATATLIAAAGSAMLGLSRLSYALSTNRQIPSALGRLHPRRGTPYVVIALAAVIAGALVLPHDLEFLVGLYAFGGLLGLTIAHVSIVVLRFREPARKRPYRMPLSVRVGGGDLPVPAVVGALLAALAWLSVVA